MVRLVRKSKYANCASDDEAASRINSVVARDKQNKDFLAEIEGTVVVSEREVQEALGKLPLLFTQVRAVPYYSNDQVSGRRIFAIRSGSLFEKLA
jgi:type II secretory pathway component PulC